MLNAKQAATMLSLQARVNSRVDPDWVAARYPYLRAVTVEGAEAIEHHGWKWWKKQDKDLSQLQLELIDIWHFILSELLLRNDNDEAIAQAQLLEQIRVDATRREIVFDARTYELHGLDLLNKLELLIGLSVSRRIELSLFAAIMEDCELTWTELYRQYVGKNVLNMFRQDKGYKEGSYLKSWHGREDNEYLVEIVQSLDPDAKDFADSLYAALQDAYPAA